jgi:hypothetical protein
MTKFGLQSLLFCTALAVSGAASAAIYTYTKGGRHRSSPDPPRPTGAKIQEAAVSSRPLFSRPCASTAA